MPDLENGAVAVKDEREPPRLLAYTLPSKGLKRKEKAIDDLARVAGVERAGLGDWEEGKKKGVGGYCGERVRDSLPFSLPLALFARSPPLFAPATLAVSTIVFHVIRTLASQLVSW